MRIGDGVLFYHSSCPEPGIADLAEVASRALRRSLAVRPKSAYYDAEIEARGAALVLRRRARTEENAPDAHRRNAGATPR